MPKVNPAVGILLFLWTILTVGGFMCAAVAYLQNRGTEPIKPGDPKIGLGILYFSTLLNVPTILCWLGVMWVERGHSDAAD